MKHRKGKLLKRLVRGNADDAVKPSPRIEKTVSLSEVMDIFAPELEELMPELMNELESKGMMRERLEEAREMGLKYNRKLNSFMSGETMRF
jgi:hypothetical protein